MSYDYYKAPPRDLCDFFLATLPELSEYEEHDQLTFARRLLEVYSGPKKDFHTNTIMSAFPWLGQAGVIESRNHYDNIRGGWRLLIRRAKLLASARHILMEAEDIYTNDCKPTPKTTKPQETAVIKLEQKKKKKKKKKKCCANPHIVRSKKTGKRRCKNCGTKLKPKKPKE